MAAGKLNHRLSFQARSLQSDGYGNEESSDFAEEFVRWAEIRPLKGGETVMAARLSGTQPVLIIVRRDSDTRTIEADWRAVDANEGTVYAITSPATDMEQERSFLTMTATAGVAA